MIRVIRTSEGEFLLDATGRKNGRGAYLCPNSDCLAKAVKNKGLERSFKQAIPKEVYEALEKEMEVLESESMIGLATKAGKVASGEFCTEKEVKSGRAYLVIVADDASDNTKKKFQNMCDFYQVPIYFYKDKDTLGHAMGKEFRASLVILDEGFAKGIRKHIDTENQTIA